MRITVVIPAYNEEYTVGEVVRKCLQQTAYSKQLTAVSHGLSAVCRVIVVDDGSTDRTAQAAREAGALTLSHPINRGLGAALSTGIEAALLFLADSRERSADSQPLAVSGKPLAVIVTLDADLQHNPAEIPRLIEPILKGEADVVIGSRFLHNPRSHNPLQLPLILRGRDRSDPPLKVRGGRGSYEMPFMRRAANLAGNLFTWLLFGVWVSDSQSGFRAFSAEAAAKLRLRTSTMEVSSEIIREIARLKLRLKEVPIIAHYTPYSLAKGQGFFRGLETLWKLIILKFFR